MINQFSSLAFAVIAAFFLYFEIKKYKTLLTPYIVSVLPLVFISLIINFFYVNTGVEPVTFRVNFFLISISFIVWLGGVIYRKPQIIQQSKHVDVYSHFKPFVRYKTFLIIIGMAISILTAFRVMDLVNSNGGWLFLGTQKYEDQMTRGITAHLIIFGEAVFVLLYMISAKTSNKKLSYLVLAMLSISVFMLMVKYNLLWLIMIIFFLKNINKTAIKQVNGILKIFLTLTTIFILYFVFLELFSKESSFNNKIWEYLYKMFLNYFLTGPIVLDHWLNTPAIKPDWAILVVFENLKNVIIGNPFRVDTIELLSNGFESLGNGIFSNIGTSYGVYYLIGGYPFAYFMTLLMSLLSYSIFHRFFNKTNIFSIFFICYMLTINSLNFFGLYITILSFYEFPIFFILLVWGLKLYNKIDITK